MHLWGAKNKVMQIKYCSEHFTPYGGLFVINELFKNKGIKGHINQHLGSRGIMAVYSYADIIMSIIYSQLSNGSAIEDIHELKKKHLSEGIPICSSDTALNMLKSLAIFNEAHLTKEGTVMEINHHPVLNKLLFGGGGGGEG